jgi:hypothetical protein
MLPLAIWLFLVGYTIAIAGKRNLGLSFQPQADGSIKAVDQNGNVARTWSLMDVVTCAGPGGSLPGSGPGGPGQSGPSGSGTRTVQGPRGPFQGQPGPLPWMAQQVVQNQNAGNAPNTSRPLSAGFQPPETIQNLLGLPSPQPGYAPLQNVWRGLQGVVGDLGGWLRSHL